ncbi:hypothetical protein HNP73_002555 [Amaricoccus macauensis]|uniref:VWFA domain-containing protein n=1 Tax=Amaricoccus macauensis TaxID=57001 RepID=A0A840SHY3_9RHOB|nr:hypothetical protein [Amaricoccus macauensis]
MTRFPRIVAGSLLLTFISAACVTAQDSTSATMLVYDVSGSMWGRLDDGTTKVESARKVLRDYLASADPETAIGVVAYGHRRKGDCADIELIAPPSTDTKGLADRIDALMPVGKTPLTAAMQQAYEALPKTAEEADLILITDGLETCEGDPCALADELAASGVTVRAHVVGFGLSEEEANTLSCLPEKTGGQLLRPQSGEELKTALTRVSEPVAVKKEPPAEPITQHVDLVTPDDQRIRAEKVTVTAVNDDGEKIGVRYVGGTSFTTELVPGDWTFTAASPDVSGEVSVTLTETTTTDLPVTLKNVTGVVRDPGQVRVDAETTFLIDVESWGPSEYNALFVYPEGAKQRSSLVEEDQMSQEVAGTFWSRPIRLPGPGKYLVGLAPFGAEISEVKNPITVEATFEPQVTITLPSATATRAELLPIEITGGHAHNDNIWFQKPGSNDRLDIVWFSQLWNEEAGRMELRAPKEVGDYTLHYGWQEDGKWVTATEVPLTVTK